MAEVTGMRNNALPYPVYGAPWTVVFPMLDADGDLVTGATTPDAEVSLNGNTFADCTNESTEIATNSGMYYLTLTGAEMTADIVALIAKSATAGMKTTPMVLYPRKLVSLRAGTVAANAADGTTLQLDSGAVAVDDYYNGCLLIAVIDSVTEARVISDYVGSTKVCTVSPAFNTAPDNNDTFTVYLPEGLNVFAALPAFTPGAASGLPILGSNTGPLSISGGVTFSNSGGDALTLSSSGSNGSGLAAAGNGSGAGIKSTGGATGHGVSAVGGATSGDGVSAAASTSGHGITATGVGTTKHGVNATGGATTSNGINATGGGVGHGINATSGGGATGDGIRATAASTNGNGLNSIGVGTGAGELATGGLTGHGISAVGGGTSGDGIRAAAATSGHGVTATGVGTTKHGINAAGGATSSHGISAAGGGAGDGLNATGGLTGNGVKAVGGGTSGHGIAATTTSGDGLNLTPTAGNGIVATGNGTSKHGLVATGGTAGTSDGIKGASGTGGVDIRGAITGNITGNVSGSIGSVATGGIAAASFAAGAIDAAAIATDAIDADSLKADAVTEIQSGLATSANQTTIIGYIDTEVAAILAAVDTEVAAIKTNTDKMVFTVTNQLDVNVIDWKGATAPAMTGDAYARLGAPAGASVSADIAAVKVDTAAVPTANQNADALLDRSNGVETGLTPRGALRLNTAALAGKVSGGATATNTFRNAVADSKDRITSTVDADGNRTAVATDTT